VNNDLKSRAIALSAASATLCLDQLSKLWALASIGEIGKTIELPGPIDLTLVLNRSNSFGLVPVYGGFSRWTLTAVNFAAAIVLLRFVLRQSTSTLNPVGLAFISAGALGNGLDRLRSGAVVDLFNASKLGFVWVFNVADVSIDLGIVLVLVSGLASFRVSKVERGKS